MFTYETLIGTFWIRAQEDGRWLLGLEEEALGSFSTPSQAAENVYWKITGYERWDCLVDIHGPAGLEDWRNHF